MATEKITKDMSATPESFMGQDYEGCNEDEHGTIDTDVKWIKPDAIMRATNVGL